MGSSLIESDQGVHFDITCLELGVVCEARQREQQTQFAVVVFRGTELLQGVETLDCFLHGELQLQKHEIFFRLLQMTEQRFLPGQHR